MCLVHGTQGQKPPRYSQQAGGSLSVEVRQYFPIPPTPKQALSPRLWDSNVQKGQAREEKITDKWPQVSVARSCCRLHDRDQQLNGCQAVLPKDPRSARLGLAAAGGLGMVWRDGQG